MQAIKLPPLPITVDGTSQRTFTLNAGVTAPVALWIGDDIVILPRTVAYSWIVGTNNTLNSSGVEADLTNSTTGVWYMYLDGDGDTILPSTTAPSYVEAKNQCGYLGHPGTDRAKNWIYVGFMVADATTPVFVAMVKIGYTYHFASQSVATTTTWAALDFTADIPAIDGIMVSGKLETGVIGTVSVSGSSVDDQGVITVSAVGLTGNIIQAPFGPIVTTGGGKVWAKDTVARGDVNITQVVDVV